MQIPDCYDPIYQAERREAEADKQREQTLPCALCDDLIFPYEKYHAVNGKAICNFCAAEIAENVFIFGLEE